MGAVYLTTRGWSSSRLLNLPLELQTYVLDCLGWEDLIAVRQTCRELFALSNLRKIWIALFHRLSRELPVPWVLERPLKSYSVSELERLVARGTSAETRWSDGVSPVETRQPVDFPFDLDTAILLDGGRWLVKTSQEKGFWGQVYIYDLDSDKESEWRCIIDLEVIEYTNPGGVSWDMTGQGSRPRSRCAWAYNLCLTLSGPLTVDSNNTIPKVDDIYIFRITIDGEGVGASLKAVKIKSLRDTEKTDYYCYDASLRGDYLVKALRSQFQHSFDFDVYNWALSDASTHIKARINIRFTTGTRNPPQALLVPDGRLVLFADRISICDLTNLKGIQDSQNPPILLPYWVSTSLPVYVCKGFSRSYRDDLSSRVTVIWDDAIYGFTIPHSQTETISFQKLSDIDVSIYYRTPFVGIGKVYASTIADKEEDEGEFSDEDSDSHNDSYVGPEEEHGLDLIPLHWDDSPAAAEGSTESLHLPVVGDSTSRTINMGYEWRDVPPLFDECSNRFLVFSNFSWIVRDFTSPHLL